MSRIHKRGPAEIHANLTPMIDVTFLLIVFFVLVSQIVEVENVDLRLPELREPATALLGDEQRSVINVVPDLSGGVLEYRVGSRSFPATATGIESLTRHVGGLLRANPGLRINLRADRQTKYEGVEPVLEAVAKAAARVEGPPVTPRLQLVVVREE